MNFFKKNESVLISIFIVVINFIIKGIFLSSNSLGSDEPYSVYHAQMDVVSIIKLLSEGNNPPFFEIILHYWIKLFGISEFSVRFPSLIFSSVTVLFLYKLGIKFFNKRIALYAGLIFIFSNYHILFAHEARVYSLLGMLSVISMYYFMWILKVLTTETQINSKLKSTLIQKLFILIVTNSLIIYSHYFGFFILITQCLFFISNKLLISKYWKHLIVSMLLIGLFYSPNILVFFNRFFESSSVGTWVKSPNGIDSLYNMLRQFSNAPIVAVFAIFLLIISFIKFIIDRKKEQKSIYAKLVGFWFVFVFFFMFAISFIVPMFIDRYLMPSAVAFCLILGISADSIIKSEKFKYIIPGIIVLLFIATVKPNISNRRNVKDTVNKIIELKDSKTLVLICPPIFILNFSYYYNKEIFKKYNSKEIYSSITENLKSENIYCINDIHEIEFKKWKKILFLDAAASFTHPNNNIKKELDANYKQKNNFHFKEIFNLFEYSKEFK